MVLWFYGIVGTTQYGASPDSVMRMHYTRMSPWDRALPRPAPGPHHTSPIPQPRDHEEEDR